ncbi:hypothetical protein DPMN_008247 [Dreissena polymorpha]|uniref:Uncharacterized protein n=1 Tax=Dreissena polymorpha TaxID=45954 RepID=A0A9D4MYU8_DREPO|nr:hypothetical protein DPMN_008247 [Dreissena polymorpha]
MRPIVRPNEEMVCCISYADSVRKETGQKSPTPMRMKEISPALTNNGWTTRHLQMYHLSLLLQMHHLLLLLQMYHLLLLLQMYHLSLLISNR